MLLLYGRRELTWFKYRMGADFYVMLSDIVVRLVLCRYNQTFCIQYTNIGYSSGTLEVLPCVSLYMIPNVYIESVFFRNSLKGCQRTIICFLSPTHVPYGQFAFGRTNLAVLFSLNI